MDDVTFKKAEVNDLDKILALYNYYISTTTATFDHSQVSREELCQKIFIDHEKYKTFLIYSNVQLAGFCFLTQYKKKKAYDRTAEIGLYLKPEFTHMGIGVLAVHFLEKEAHNLQIRVIIASISGENTASINLFKKMGYQKCAHYKRVAEKFERLLDCVDFQKIL